MKDMRLYWGIAIGVLIYFFYNRFTTIENTGTDTGTSTGGSGGTGGVGNQPTGDPAPDNPNQGARLRGVAPSQICIEPQFKGGLQFSGRVCAGEFINESKTLKKGMQGCDVLLLQQRLNNIQNTNILAPTGKFDCATLNKLKSVKGVESIRLNSFQPDEEIGFNSLEPTSKVNYSYRYMDVDKPNK